jgi:alpha-glucoside transport system substrate-binding protein
VVGGGDVAVLLKQSEGGKALIRFLATPEAGAIWARLGGFSSPNKDVDPSAYPDEIVRRSAQALVGAQTFRFDMSDQMPAAFGGTPAQGEWRILQDFLKNPSDIQGTMQRLEAAAAQAYGS